MENQERPTEIFLNCGGISIAPAGMKLKKPSAMQLADRPTQRPAARPAAQTPGPRDFGEALAWVHNENGGKLGLECVVAEARERWPELYRKYELDVFDDLGDY